MFHFMNWCGPGFGGIIWLLIIGVVIWAILKNTGSSQYMPPPTSDTNLDILKRRYAKGEITKEQFEEMKKDLGI